MTAVKIRIANSQIELGKKYILDHRPDFSAPDGMREMTKYPFDNNVTFEKVFFDDRRRQFDTCFYKESPSLKVIADEKEREELVKQYVKYIKTPYEKTFNADLEPSEKNTFWEDFKIEAWVNKTYDTANINDLIELFYLLYMGTVCEKDEKNPLLRQDSQFILISTEKSKTKSKDKVKRQSQAFLILSTMLNADRDKLNLILQWIGKDDPSKLDAEDLGVIYYQVINAKDGQVFVDKFLDAYELYDGDKGQEKMEWFYAINKLYAKRLIKKTGRGYVASDGEIYLGNTLQNIAEFCLNTSSAQHEIISKMIEENPTVRRETPEHLKQKLVK